MKKLIVIIVSLVLMCVLSGCRTAKELESSDLTNIEKLVEYRDKYHRDSIYIRDSVIVFVKGDTVYKDRWRTEYKDRVVRDTVFKTDTVFIAKEVEREQTEPPNSNWSLIIIIIILIYKFK